MSHYLFFTHILKAGGTSIEAALRHALGIRHMAVNPPVGWIYTAEDFAFDRRLNPLARSFSSHWLRPFVDFGRYNDDITWFTMLREPISRFRSHRQHHIERFGSHRPFEQWASEPIFRNWQTRQIAGEEDVEAAKQILQERFRVVGLLERMQESLALFRSTLALQDLPVVIDAVHNRAHSQSLRAQLEDEFERNAAAVRECNELDIQLYDFAANTLFVRQLEAVRDIPMLDLGNASVTGENGLGARLRSTSHLLFRRAVQLPVSRLRGRLARRRGRIDVRR